ncbi:hypothetical protein [Facklamia sp. 7083-14-GEN3]|uniref:hypothetical protein n=1 Tax=Facklamia sp. 7083-14-GEN3 TaxID=2973478 RepID=UPI00215B8960|nr:hypothetical protein [Facklamia sp. 7083-14-GEN3]MCR8969290.1 hypothetical protein [Facklamia sp. 7083-14-GEN3]
MIFYKFTVQKDSWYAEIAITQERVDFVTSDPEEIIDLYNDYKNDLWIAFNGNNYDRFILKSIIAGINPYGVHEHIMKGLSGWSYSETLNYIPLSSYDAMLSRQYSLKQLTAFQGREVKDSIEDLMYVFAYQVNSFLTKLDLLLEFKLPLKHMDKTETQLLAYILRAKKLNRYDDWEITILNHELGKYSHINDWYLNDDESLEAEVAGVPHRYGLGGLHGARKNYIGKGFFILADCKSMYPTIIDKYNFLSRNVSYPKKYSQLLKKRFTLQKKKDSKELVYKSIVNKGFGASGDQFSLMYDMQQYHNVVINGQLFMTDLIDKLDPYIELIQTNTDGVLFKIDEKDFDLVDCVCAEWEERTGLTLAFKYYDYVYQKDVNNYIFIGDKVEAAGAYVKDLNHLDNDLPIVNRAIREYFINGVDVSEIINKSNSLIDFQRIIKAETIDYGGEYLYDKVYRVFADKYGQSILRINKGKKTKIGNIPDFCRIVNEDIVGQPIPGWLNKQWYIDLANKRVNEFLGVKNTAKNDSVVEQISFW